jgi:hypothetical protein
VLVPESEHRLRAVRRRLGALLALYWAGLAIAAAVEQTAWHWAPHLDVAWAPGYRALATAILGGAPLGYFLAFGIRRRDAIGSAVLAGLALGLVLEGAAWVDERAVAPLAIVARAASAAAGAIAFLLIAARLRARARNDAPVLAPDLPLVGGAYVAAPLVWLASTNAAPNAAHTVPLALVPVVLFGATLIGSARASRGAAGGRLAAYGLAAAAWCLCGVAPLIPSAPATAGALVALAAGFALLHPILLGIGARDRRVEGPALRRALPLHGLYLLLASLGPLAAHLGGRAGHSDIWAVLQAAVPAWSWTEQAAALVTFGYAVAELRGRREERRGPAWRAVLPWALAAAVATTALRVAAAPTTSAWALVARAAASVALGVLAGRAGFGLYELQRRHARAHAIEGGSVRETTRGTARATPPAHACTATPVAPSRRLESGERRARGVEVA